MENPRGRTSNRASRQGLVLDHDEVTAAEPVRKPAFPAKRWLLALGMVVLLLAAWLGWRNNAPVKVELPVVNVGDSEVQLLLHGDGIDQHALVILAPGERHTLTLSATHGALRVQSEGPRAKLDAVLLNDARALKGALVQLEVRSAGELVLVPRSE